MRLRQDQILRLAEKVYNDLDHSRLIVLRSDRSAVLAGIAQAVSGDISAEQLLDRDAERILEESLAGMGRAAIEIDRRKMLRMIKDKLAKERKIVL